MLRAIILVGIVAYLAWRIVAGWPAIRSVSVRWSALELVGAFLLAAAAFPCLIAGWLILLRRAGYYRRRHLRAYVRIWWVSYVYRWVPGKVLLLVERARMGSGVGIPPPAGAALAVIETIIAVLAAAWVSVLALLLYVEQPGRLMWAVGVVSIVALFVLPVVFRAICRLSFVARRFPDLATVALGPRDVLVALPAFLLHYVFLGLSLFLCARGVQDLSWTQAAGIIGAFALSQGVGLVIMIAPAGLGVREGVLGLQLAAVMPAGVAEAVAIGARAWFTLVELISFGVVLLLTPRRRAAAPPATRRGEGDTGSDPGRDGS
ncbi:MAG: hypothetical protein GY715_09770 [Planctomycetes bacterium]|nr:hypothetical protein [Planctomycetota bacterium]